MQSDTEHTTTSMMSERIPYTGTTEMTGQKQFTDYLSDFGDAFTTGTGKTVNYFTDHPLLSGSLIIGAMGAFLGSRLGHMLAMRRRKSFYDRMMDSLSLWVAMLGAAMSAKNRERALAKARDASRTVMGSTEEVRSSLKDRIPTRLPFGMPADVEVPKMEEKPSAIKQIGYGISLIPVTMALVRNPLVRDIAFRFVAQRVRPRRRR